MDASFFFEARAAMFLIGRQCEEHPLGLATWGHPTGLHTWWLAYLVVVALGDRAGATLKARGADRLQAGSRTWLECLRQRLSALCTSTTWDDHCPFQQLLRTTGTTTTRGDVSGADASQEPKYTVTPSKDFPLRPGSS